MALLAAGPARAVETVRWTATDPAILTHGLAEDVAISARGALALAPRLDALLREAGGRDSQPYFWSAALDGSGRLAVGTGPDGRVFVAGPDGSVERLAELPEPHVTALASARDGVWYAATSPRGSVYRIDRSGAVDRLFDPDELYIWALAATPEGVLFAGTGERGRIYRIDGKDDGRLAFDGDEPHVVSLARARDGRLLAGTAGRGLLLSLDVSRTASGGGAPARVLLDSDRPEVTAIAEDGGGSIYAAAFAAPAGRARGPGLRVRLDEAPDPAQAFEGPLRPPELDDGAPPSSATRAAVIEETQRTEAGAYGEASTSVLFRVPPDGPAEEIWSAGRGEGIHSLAVSPEGTVWIGTGPPARVRRIENPGLAALVARLPESQVTSLALDRRGRLYAATSNAGGAYRIGHETAERGRFTSAPLDGRVLSRWGTVAWEAEVPSGARLELRTRTGSSPEPDATWSEWSAPYPDPGGSRTTSPPGRYLQWRADLFGTSRGGPVLRHVSLFSRPANRPPVLSSAYVPNAGAPSPVDLSVATAGDEPGDDPAGAAGPEETGSAPDGGVRDRGRRWVVTRGGDPDGDPLIYRLVAKPAGGGGGRPLDTDTEAVPPIPFRDDELAEGRWILLVEASDERANPAGTSRTARIETPRFTVDRTPPVLTPSGRTPRGEVRILAEDALSTLTRAEYSRDGRLWLAAASADGILDGSSEEILVPADGSEKGEATMILRVRDAAGNESRLELGAGAAEAERR